MKEGYWVTGLCDETKISTFTETFLSRTNISTPRSSAEKSNSVKKAERRKNAEKEDLVMQLAFWQKCQNAIK